MSSDNRVSVLLDDPINTRRHSVPGPGGVKLATDDPNRGKQCKSIKKTIRPCHRIGTWNIRGLLKPGKLSIVEKEMDNLNLDLLGVSETHMRKNGHFTTTAGNTLYFSGADDSSLHGVGILIPPKLNRHVLGYNPVSSRIIALKLDTKPCTLNIIQIYAPTSQSSEEEIEQFYGKLEETLNAIPNRQISMVLGDWNAKIGNTISDVHLRSIVGSFGLGNRNERGERMLDFCNSRNLSILNTFFKHHPRRLYTWKSPGDRYRNQIDFILINTRWRSSVHNVKTFPGADCGSDHNLLVANFALRLKAPKQRLKSNLKQFDPDETKQFQQILENKLKTPPTVFPDANTQWLHLKATVVDVLDSMPKKAISKEKRSVWISDRTWILAQRRKDLKIKGLQNQEVLKEYSQLSRSIDMCCKQDKDRFIQDICKDIEQHATRYQTADLFKKVRLLSRKFKPKNWIIEDANGHPLFEQEEISERWRNYCEELYKYPYASSTTNSCIPWNVLDKEPDIMRCEIISALHSLKNKKAPGPDTITAEILKALGDYGVNQLLKICNSVWTNGDWPRDWTQSTILPLHKKGSTRQCENYRTLALISHASKVLLHVINKRIRYYLDWQISQEQAGFVKGKGTREQILNVRQLIEKAYEYNVTVVMCFVDYSKAFDCVDWGSLWRVLGELGVPEHLIALLQMLYYSSEGVVKIDKTTSQPFKFGKGVRQGCILSPILFNVYGEYIIRQTCDDWEGGVRVGGMRLTNLRYADDTTLLAANELEMVTILEKMERISNGLGLSINKSKTKIMIVDRAKELQFTGALNLQVVEDFTYLGSNISNNGSCEKDVRRRIGMAKNAMSQLDKTWRDRNISLKTKLNLVKTLVFSIFLYGAETWTLRSADRNRIDAFEMWCWRRMLRIPWTAYRTNVSILRQIKITTRLSTICLKKILDYFGHIARKEDGNLEKLVVTGKVEGKRSRGRSPMRWSDQIRTTLNTSVYDALHTAKDRTKWRTIVRSKVIRGGGHDPQT